MQFFSKMSGDPKTAQYRSDIFDDIFNNPEMSSQLIKVLEHINYEKQYSGFSGHYEESDSAWELLHRLEEISDYIKSVETIHECLLTAKLKSQGMKNLKAHIDGIYSENGFAELKKDIQELKATTSDLKSITVGINLNEKYEASGIGLISFNKKPFTKSSAIGEFCSKITPKDSLNENADWDKSFKFLSRYIQSDASNALNSLTCRHLKVFKFDCMHFGRICSGQHQYIVIRYFFFLISKL